MRRKFGGINNMAISMTGFGRGEFKNDNYHFLVECKTINHKIVI